MAGACICMATSLLVPRLYTPVSAPPGSVRGGRFENEEWFSAPLPLVRPSSRQCGPLGRHPSSAADTRPPCLDGAVKQKKRANRGGCARRLEAPRTAPSEKRPLAARLNPLDVPPDLQA